MKTVKVAGLHSLLAWLAPACKSIAGNSVTVADGVVVNLPDDSTLTFMALGDPNVIHVAFSGLTATIDRRSLLGLVHIHATEPVAFADVGPDSVGTQVSLFRIVAVDDGSGP